MPSIGNLTAHLGLDTTNLDQNADKSERRLTKLTGTMRDVASNAAKMGVAAGVAGLALATALVKSSADSARELSNLSRVAGVTTKEFQRNAFAARSVGVENDKLADIYKDVNDKIGDFLVTGAGPLVDFFETVAPKVGVTADEFRELSGPQALGKYVQALEDANVSQNQMTFFMEAIASDATALVPLLRNGSSELARFGDEAESLGLVLSDIDIATLQRTKKAFSDIGAIVESVKVQVGAGLAPYFTEVTERITAMAKASGGFEDEIEYAINTSIRGFSKVADVIQGLRVAFKASEVVATGFGAAMVSVADIVIRSFANLGDKILAINNLIIDGLNKLPNVDIAKVEPFSNSAFIAGLREFADESRDKVSEVRGELHALAMQELPSSKVEAFLAAVRDRAQEAAAAVASASPEGDVGAGGGGGIVVDEDDGGEAERMRERLADQLSAVQEYVMSEAELLNTRHEERLEVLQEALENELLTETEHRALLQEIEQDHVDTLEAIRYDGLTALERLSEASYSRQASAAANFLANMTSTFASENKKLFKIHQTAAISRAIIDSKTAIVGAYSFGASVGGPYVGAAFAAIAALTTLQEISSIRAQSFGGGGGGGGGGGAASSGGSAPAAAESAGSARVVNIQGLNPGDLFTGSAVRGLLGQMQELIDDGAEVRFS